MSERADIAIVGVAGCYAGARDARAFWKNILNKVDAVSAADAEWTGPYLDTGAANRNDRIYTNRGGFLRDLAEFNPLEFGIMPAAVDGGEPDHYLALRLARDALADAGYAKGGYDAERAGVILGRGTYINRGYTTLMQHGMAVDQMLAAVQSVRPDVSAAELEAMREQLKKQLPAFNAEMCPGLVPNVTTGLIANRLNLMGPNFIIDAACASSLISVELAVRELESGRCDMVLAGGVQAHTPPQLFMIFCQLGALSRGQVRPFDRNAGGTLLGEGAGILVLKRLEDAEQAGDRIYAVIRGIGSSSDGRAKGLLAPRLEGEVLALQRAYFNSEIDPATVGLIEAHGTGIALGDRTEIESLTQIFGPRKARAPAVAIGSVKSMISHCIPAAGSASLIKTAMALHHKVLPPTLCDEVNPELELERTPFYVNTETRPWVHDGKTPRRAGVNAFGFGGVNAHVILEEYRPKASGAVAVQWHAPKDAELYVFAGDSPQALGARLAQVQARVLADENLSLGALAKHLADHAGGAYRAAIVADEREALLKQIEDARKRIERGETQFRTRGGLFGGSGASPGKVVFLFPGEGAQYAGMLRELAVAFPQVRSWFDFLDRTFGDTRGYRPSEAIFPAPGSLSDGDRAWLEERLFKMDLASESVFAASQALHGMMRELGVSPDAMLGHSTGENTALVASGRLRTSNEEGLSRVARELNQVYRKLESEGRIAEGKLLTVGAARAGLREDIIKEFGTRLQLAMDNCPNQFVLFGSAADIAQAHTRLTEAGAVCAELPFGRAYHTALFAPVAQAFRKFWQTLDVGPGEVPLYSCADTGPFPVSPDAIRDRTCEQWAKPVRFRETVQRLYDSGFRVFVELGPSANLTSFVTDTLRGKDGLLAVSTNSRRQPDLRHFFSAVAQLWTSGVPLKPAALFAHRALPEVDLAVVPPAASARPRLNLNLPALKLPAKPLPAAPAAAPAPVATPALAGTTAPRVAGSDTRVAALQGHFALMQEFLASQMRVLGALGVQPVAGAPVAPQAPAVTAANAPAISADAFPMLGAIVERSATRLVSERSFDLNRDGFLRDHTIGGKPSALDASLLPIPVIPFTFSMEVLAEAAACLMGGEKKFVGLENVRGHRWLSLDDGRMDVRIVAERDGERVHGRIFLKAEGAPAGGVLVFEGTVLFAAALPAAPAAMGWTSAESHPARHNPDGELYAHGMFHGPRLQGVKHLRRWSEDAIEADLETIATGDYFSFTAAPRFQFDAALLDAAGQLAGYWLTEKHTWGFNCFPFRLARFVQYAPAPTAGTRVLCRGQLRFAEEHVIEAAFDLISQDGTLLARAEGWEDRKFTVPQRLYDYRLEPQARHLSESFAERAAPGIARRIAAFPEGFLDEGWGIWKRMLAHMALTHGERTRFYALPPTGPRREEWLLGRIAAKEAARVWIQREYGLTLSNADIEVAERPGGKPVLEVAALAGKPAPSISLAHSRRWAAAAADAPAAQIGFDYQRVERINVADLVQGGMTDAERARIEAQPSEPEQRRLAVATWCAKEAAAKALGEGLQGRPRDWEVVELSADRRHPVETNGGAQARVKRGAQLLDVILFFESEDEVAALCRVPSAATLRAAG